ncbi:hypothetical protein [Paenibacillus sp.]|uniref:hypothetical protein n=1 Tax=Paenibacillus sp. TaxID=58172 RepID=UPI002D2C9804|nr:hypothetical protein [Paenibacillus sp.]HZG86233.1 hypothetical protein [Paenibacillus sp.]
MLQRLLSFGVENGIFKILPIKDIDKSCCKVSTTEVIDFDETKRMIIAEINSSKWKMQEPKSCDALKIIPQVNRLDFIEFKGLNTFLERLEDSGKNVEEEISKQIGKFEFGTKIFDSFQVLDYVLKSAKFGMSKTERQSFALVEKNYFIMVDIEVGEDGIQDFALMMEFLSQTSNVRNTILSYIKEDIKGLGGSGIVKMNSPKLINVKEVDKMYASVLSAVANQ